LANQNPVLSPFDSPSGRHGVEAAAWMPAISDEVKVCWEAVLWQAAAPQVSAEMDGTQNKWVCVPSKYV